ncbi:MAG TPA: sugar phosphate isomerase/epimerase family protein [bacterium]|nr:sugar phosphate isomerase/epimerase family protein [bacterium]HOL65993.1 sugar phosphate isomerase/epimerase family protein [bacterium]HPP12397.1 sugar phosphate isomerase/epimerase family protein [bacterium]
MKPGIWTSYLIELSPREMVKTFAAHGWAYLELSDEHGHDLLKEGDPLTIGAAFRRYAADYGLTFPQGHLCLCTKGCRPEDLPGREVMDIAPPETRDFQAAMEMMKRWVDLFQGLGIKAGVIHAGGDKASKAGWSPERIFEQRVKAIRQVAEYSRGGPTVLCLENMNSPGLRTAGELLALKQATGMDNIALCLDTSHAILSGVDPAIFIREAGAALQALHLSDNLGSHDDHMLPYGRGLVAWAEAMTALRQVRYAGLFNLEIPGENRCPLPVRLAKLDYARNLLHWMIEFEAR